MSAAPHLVIDQQQIANDVDAEVAAEFATIKKVVQDIGVAAFMKLIPTHRDLHRHVAVLLPEYDGKNYHYDHGNSSSMLKGPGGLKWKTRRSPDEDNDPRFPKFW